MKTTTSLILSLSLFLTFFPIVDCFQLSLQTATSRFSKHSHVNVLKSRTSSDDDDEIEFTAGGDSYEGEIDWDAEWKKVVKTKGNIQTDRPGKDFYKNDVQRVAVKASRAANEQIRNVKIVKPDINIRSLQGDGKFWVGMLAILSIGLALISAPDMGSYTNSNDSLYI